MTWGQDLLANVAALLDSAKWKVAVEQSHDGFQIDIVATDPSGREVIIECKAYSRLAGLRTVREFASIVEYLRQSKPDLEGWLVTTQGFTTNAQRALARYGLIGRTLDDLRSQFADSIGEAANRAGTFKQQARDERRRQRRVFVIMPFSDAMLDVFVFGIRWAANELKAVAERADNLEHNGEIITEIRQAIEQYDAVVADTSGANPNVCYEVGYAHALRRPTVLICKHGEKLPFDLQGTNHLLYRNILDLREPLKRKLEAALRTSKSDI